MTFGFAYFDRTALNFLTPFIVPDLELSNTQVGLLSSGLSITWALSAYVIGRWSDAAGVRKPFLLAFIAIFCACSFLSGIAPSFMLLLVARMIMGAAEGPVLPVCLAIVNAESSPHRRGINAGFLQNFFGTLLGGVLAPLMLVALANAFSWRVAFYIAGIPGLICGFAVWLWVREPQDSRPVTQHERLDLWQMLRVRNIWLCCLISICLIANVVVLLAFLPLYLTSVRGYSTTLMSWIMSVAGMAGPFAFLVAALSDRIGRKPAMVAFSFAAILAPWAALYFHGPPSLLATIMFAGMLSAGTFPLFMGIIPGETISRRHAATAMGLIVGVGEIGGGVATPTIAGWLADRSTLAAPLMIAGAAALVAGVLALLLEETAPVKVGAIRPADDGRAPPKAESQTM
jgi:MFS transporter, ACS family, hexuronate transporter